MSSILTPNIVSLLITTAFNVLLAFFILSKNRKSPVNRIFSFLALGVALWSFTNIATQIVKTVHQGILWSQISYLSTLIIAVSFFLFSIIFPEEEKMSKSRLFIPVIIAAIVTSVLLFIPKFVIETVTLSPWKIMTNRGAYLYTASFVGMLLFSFGNILRKYRQLKGEQKAQIKFVLIGTLATATIGIFFNLLLPIFFNYYGLVWFGPNAGLVMVGFIAYAVIRHHLFDIKVIATEIFSILISLSALIDALLSQTPTEFTLKFLLFSAISLFSILLIRGVLKEVKTREQLAALTEKLQKANDDLQKLDKAKSEFISIASHQLRTPLSVIKGFVSMLIEGSYGKIPDKGKELLSKIGASSDRLNRLIDDLLDLSRMEGGQMKYEWNFINLAELAGSVGDELQPQAGKKGHNL